MSRHSNDLRQRAVDFVKQGNTKTDAIKIFKIARQTLYDWLKLDKLGKLTTVKPFTGARKSKVSLLEFQTFLEQNPDLYYREIAKEFKISIPQACRLTRKLNFTVKKNSNLQRSRRAKEK
jgi:transposase